MTLKLGMQRWMLEYYQVCSNDDPELTLTILQQGQIWSLMLLYGKKVKQWIFQKLLSSMIWTSIRWRKWQEASIGIKTLSPGGCSMPSAPGLCTCIISWKKFFLNLQQLAFMKILACLVVCPYPRAMFKLLFLYNCWFEHILSSQVSDTGPINIWFFFSVKTFHSRIMPRFWRFFDFPIVSLWNLVNKIYREPLELGSWYMAHRLCPRCRWPELKFSKYLIELSTLSDFVVLCSKVALWTKYLENRLS